MIDNDYSYPSVNLALVLVLVLVIIVLVLVFVLVSVLASGGGTISAAMQVLELSSGEARGPGPCYEPNQLP